MDIQLKALSTITLNGNAQKITAVPTKAVAIIFQCPSTNTGNTVVECNASISSSHGVYVAPGKEISLGAGVFGGSIHGLDGEFELSDFYVKGTNTESIRISYVKKA
jgi:hypothetical protein